MNEQDKTIHWPSYSTGWEDAKFAELKTRPQWISVDERLPESAEYPVLVYTPIKSVEHRIIKDALMLKTCNQATHWMSIPPTPPEGE